ncbi:MAG: transporter substrate-binding domain-containing protein [Gammaproteobacteria bacterium]|nr:transporter substrate-binding domain-containing protein [Gammaproteobacteria bacterium]
MSEMAITMLDGFAARAMARWAAAGALMLLLASCGSPDEESGGPETAVDTESAVHAAAVAATEIESDIAYDVKDGSSLVAELLPERLRLITEPWFGDLDGMQERRAIRVLVVAGGPQFFYYRGRPRGIVAEVLEMYQKQLNKQLGRGLDAVEVIPMPVSRDRLFSELEAGHADLIAADLTVTDERAAKFDYTIPVMRNVDELIVFGPGFKGDVKTLDDMAGRALYVRKSSSYYEHILRLNRNFEDSGLEPIRVDPANEYLRTLDVAEMVNTGLVGATVLDSHKAKSWQQIFPDLVVRENLAINTGGDIAWFFREESPLLEKSLNDFLRTHRQGTLIGNVLLQRYVENVRWIHNATSDAQIEKLWPMLELFRAAARETRYDPLMLVAQAFQESGLDHSRRSSAGAVGIMQVKPSTAADKNVGIPNIDAVADNIRAGARYMRFLQDRYFTDSDMNELERWVFALAAYNAGPARIQRLRRIAAEEGHDPNRWLDNVEIVAARKIGRETVRYVRNVFKYYVAYRLSWERRELRQSLDTNPPAI